MVWFRGFDGHQVSNKMACMPVHSNGPKTAGWKILEYLVQNVHTYVRTEEEPSLDQLKKSKFYKIINYYPFHCHALSSSSSVREDLFSLMS